MRDWVADIKYAVRILVKAPGFTIVALVTLALGIGANTAIFSVLDAVLLKPLPFAQPQQIAALWGTRADRGENQTPWSYPDFRDVRDQNKSFESLAGYSGDTGTVTGQGEAQHVAFEKVSASMFGLLRVKPILGRDFTSDEDAASHFVLVLSNAYWHTHYGGEANAIGQTMVIDGKQYTIVGVLPATFTFPFENEEPGIYTTFSRDATPSGQSFGGDAKPITEERGSHWIPVLGRLRDGVSFAQANADLAVIAKRLEAQYPDSNGRRGFRTEPAVEGMAGALRAQLYILLGAVMLVLLIACANVANLMLARGAAREREIGIRFAMGAQRGRIVRQLLLESGLLAFAGGACGLLMAVWVVAVIRRMTANQVPRIGESGIDARVLIFSIAVMAATGLLFGLIPALQLSRRGVGETLKEGGRSASGSVRQNRIKNTLVVTEMIFAVMLLMGAGLLMKSLQKLERVDPGFVSRGLVSFEVNVPDSTYAKPEQAAEFFKRLMSELRTIPGVESVSGTAPLPLSGDAMRTTYAIDGRPVKASEQPVSAVSVIDPEYFSTMKIPLLQGRAFTEADQRDSTQVVIINRRLAEQSFPGENPIGKRIKPGISWGEHALMREIVGVVGDTKERALERADEAEVYVPESQMGFPFMAVVMRARGVGATRGGDGDAAMAGLVAMAREKVKGIDKQVPIYAVKSMDEYVAASIVGPRMNTGLLGCFAGLAVLLALVGIYGVISYGVSQRVGEIGIRMTLGAQRADVMKMVLGGGLKMAAIGVGIGALAAVGTNRLLASLLFGVRPGDASIFVGVIVVLVGCAVAACWVPARRAMEVSPMEALRYE
jgi:putative ABC transport system permease protein